MGTQTDEAMATYVVTQVTPLYFSKICRLCASENAEGINVYEKDSDLKMIMNKYLPVKVEDDGKLPCTICPGCHIQLASTKQFFDLIVEGQSHLRKLWSQEVTIQKCLQREKQFYPEFEGNSKEALYANEAANENDILIKIFPDEPFFSENHELSLKVDGLDKPRRKRGRPRKQKPPDDNTQPDQDLTQPALLETLESDEQQEQTREEEDEFGDDENGRRRRRRRKPKRFMEAVAGKELDRILREEGAIDGFESDETVLEENLPVVEVRLEESADAEPFDTTAGTGEIIGHLTTPDGCIAETIVAPPTGRGPYRKRKPHKFVCDFCNQAFRDRTRWIKHRLSHKGLRFQCSDISCLVTFTSRSKLIAHQTVAEHRGMEIVEAEEEAVIAPVDEQPQFLCVSCGNVFNTTVELATHVETEHSMEKEGLEINILQPEANIPQILKEEETPEQTEIAHNQTAQDGSPTKGAIAGKHQCDECNRSFNHASSLIYHKESSHNDGRRFVCVKCNKSFSHKQLLHRHQMVHSDSRPFACSKCGMSFKTKSNLFNHRVVHTGEKRFSCESCGQQFAHKTSLNLHKSWHQGIRPFKCVYCSKCFTQSGNLREHLRIHNGEKPFQCTYCTKTFTTSSQHRLHLKRHTGDRPWKCQYCTKHFLHKDTWKTHERRHTGEKPFQCTYCNRGFAEHWSLKKHIRLHTGEKPYKCEVCGKEFADCSNLTKHKKVHGVPAGNMEQNQVWGLIKTHLNSGPDANDDMKQVIFVTYQDPEEKEGAQIEEIEQEQPPAFEEAADNQNTGQTMTFLDEEGNPVQLPLPDGRTVEIVSLDTETNVVQVRTSEGWTILLQMPQNREIVEEEMLEQIRVAVAEAKASEAEASEGLTVVQSDEIVRNDSNSGYKLQNMTGVFTPSEQAAQAFQLQLEDPSGANQQMVIEKDEKAPGGAQQTYTLRLAKPMELVGDFTMEALKEEYLINE